jgi:hypothetical protein
MLYIRMLPAIKKMRHNLFIVTLLIFGFNSSNEKPIQKKNIKDFKNLIQQDSSTHQLKTIQSSKTINPIFKFINEKDPNLKTGIPSEIPLLQRKQCH